MEFQNVGKHCSESTCRQQDFLPFTCNFCNKTFCLDHRDVKSHACPKGHSGDTRAIICPVCSKTLNFDAGSTTGDEHWNMHFATECKPENYGKAKSDKSKTCETKGCREKLTAINTYKCKTCRRELCLKHRFEDQHECGYNAAANDRPNRYDKLAQNSNNHGNSGGVQSSIKNFFGLNNGGSKQPQPQSQQNMNQTQSQEVCGICSQKFANLEELISHAEKAHY